MTGENFKRVNRGTEVKRIKEKIYNLQAQCGELYRICRDTGYFDSEKHDRLSKEIEWQKYLLWGLTEN